MKRFARRTLAVIIGAGLGLYSAGLYNESRELSAMAQTEHAHEAAPAPAAEAAAGEHHAASAEPAAEGHGHGAGAVAGEAGHDKAHDAAHELVPHAGQVDWYRPVVLTGIGLFVAALVLGSAALKIRGPLPPDPADTHDDHAHDDHAHDAHGHDDHGHKADDKSHGHH